MSEEPTVEQLRDAYRGIRGRVRVMIEASSEAHQATVCPTTPAWRVRDTLAHLCGVPSDILAGNLEGVASDAWTQAQVDARRDTPVAALLDAWDDEGTQIEPMMPLFPIVTLGQMVFDAVTHELDIAHALGVKADHDSDAVVYSFDWVVRRCGPATQQPLTLRTEVGEIAFGEAPDPIAIEISRFDFMRAVTGRRSTAQIEAYPSSRTLDPQKVLIEAIFTVSAFDVVE